MPSQPQIETRSVETYVAVERAGTKDEFREAVDSGFPELFGLLGKIGIEPAGPPFIRYIQFDLQGDFEIEIGVPVEPRPESETAASPHIRRLPAGRYAVYMHVGAYMATTPRWEGRDLQAAHGLIADWADREGIEWEGSGSGASFRAAARIERYLAGPPQVEDPAEWRTEISTLIRD